MKNVPLVVLLFLTQLAISQVKIGDNINQIDAASLMELESASRVLVVTRVNNAQMNTITPLNGALVFNTDENCLFQYTNNLWSSLCVNVAAGETVTALLENNDGTVTYTNEAGNPVIISKANLIDNLDGSFTFNNGSGPLNFTGTDDQNLENANLDETTSILTVEIENGNNTTADLSALEESADITAVQNDVDQNESDADTAITAVQDDVDQNEADADAAILAERNRAIAAETAIQNDVDQNESDADNAIATVQNDVDQNEADADASILAERNRAIAAETAIQNDVDQNESDADNAIIAVQNDVDQNEADADAAIALKEDSANKSDDVTLADATDTKFPTELAVKTYVDGRIAATADDDITGASINASSVLKIDEGTSSVTVDLSALEESADITALQNDVDQNESDADSAITAVQTDVDQNEADADAAILAERNRAIAAETAIQNDVDQNETDADTAIAAVQTDVDQNEADADAAILAERNRAIAAETAIQNDVDQNETDADNAIAAVQNDVDQNEADADAAILAVQNDVDQNETDADNAIAAIQTDVNQNEADADAAIALKEDAANKSTDVTLADATDTKFPTELAVKTYVDGQITATADDDITGASINASSVLKIDEGTSSVTVDLSALEESAAITAVQDDVDQNEADADAAILAERNRAIAAETAIQNDVDQNESDADSAIIAVQNDVDQNEADADAAILAVQNDVDQNETDADATILTERNRAIAAETAIQNDVDQNEADADAAIALKEDSANKSTDVTLADATDTKFPTELAVKTYVDGQITATADDDITAASINASSVLKIDEGTSSVTVDLSALEESADITAVQNDVDQNESDADSAIAAVQTDVDQNEADADAAIALKEDAANKSTDVTLADATDTKFPTELAVKTYVDGQITATADDDITAASINASSVLKIDEGATSVTVDLSALEESAAITAVQDDVDQNEADADAAILAVQNDVDQNETDADAAILTERNRAIAAETAIQNDVDQNEADADAAIALKEDSANKSTDVTLADATDTKFPTELAVKTYVDGQITATADDDITAASINASSVLKIDEGTSSVTVDLSALEESADITAVQNDVDQNEADADAAILAVQNDVDQNETDADAAILTERNRAIAAETAIQNDVDQNESDADSAIIAVQNDVDQNETDADNAIAAVQTDVDQNEADADAAIALKEDAANKSTDVTLADATDTKFPTELAVKTYVDGQITATADDDITAASINASSVLKIDEGTSSVTVDLSALEESAAITAVQDDVDQNEADADAAILAERNRAIAAETAIQNDVDQNESDADAAIALKEDSANKSTDVTLADATDTKFPTELAVKTYVDGQITATADDDITAASINASSVLKIDEGATSVTVDLSALEESADITAVQDDVDQNEADADAAILAVQNDVNQNEADADAAIALKEDSANKSTDVTLADATDTKFPTELAVKTYVDGQITATADDDITAASINASSVLKIDEGTSSVTVDLSALEESAAITAVQDDVDQNEADADAAILAERNRAIAAETAIQNDVDQNESDADNAIAAVQTDVDQNEADADAAIALKEDSANKSTDVTLADATDTKFPTELAVKTYVDGQITATADDDITAASINASSVLKIVEGTSSVTVDLSALEESAAITAVQDDVDQNEADADAAILAERNRAIAAETAIQNDVDQNEADADAAIALKEDSANKSTDVTLADATDTKFPTELAVKTYVDGQITATADDDITAASINASSVLKIDEGTSSVTVDLSALEESAAITAVQDDVDQNEADADAAIAVNTAAITAHNSADNDLSETNEIQTLSVSGNDLSISGTGGNTVTLPSISGTEGSVFFSDASGNPTENNSQLFWDDTENRLGVGTATPENKLDVSGAIRSRGILNSDGTVGEPSYRFSDDTNTGMYSPAADEIGLTVGGIEAINIDETSNKTTVTINETLDVDGQILDENDSAGTAGQVLSATATGTEWVDPPSSTGNASISADDGNSITAGSDSGVFYASPIKAFGKVSALGVIVKSTPNIIVSKLAGLGHYLVTLPIGITLDSDYIIQLSQPGRGGAGNDDPGISYSNQTIRTFEVIIGDNDNGGTDRARFDSEFMFTVLDL
ncbi:hypothetical protein [Zobellia roscoffensis]|uniref:hypothetical protein n=1 Tax=Zobellia roscoffensis TaxID=2779508 RepID=UPI00188BF22D|nr:hypothetical protein [Zobellia roscoffensis]